MSLIDDKIEKIDTTRFKRKLNQYSTNPNAFLYVGERDTLPNGTVNIILGSSSDSQEDIKPKKGWFNIAKGFYGNTSIKYKEVYNKTFEKNKYGKEYNYNKDGQLTSVIDHDKSYNNSIEDIIIIAKKYAGKYNFPYSTRWF